MKNLLNAVLVAASSIFLAGTALAQTSAPSTPVEDVPIDGAIVLRDAASPLAVEVHIFHNLVLLPVMVIISVFVLALLIWVMVRYNKKANPVPQKFSHNTLVEVIWTGVPILILGFISVFSFDLLYQSDRMPDGQTEYYAAGTKNAGFPNDFVDSRKIRSTRHLELSLIEDASGEETPLAFEADYDVSEFGDEEVVISLKNEVPVGSRLKVIGGRSRMGQKKFLDLFGEDKSQIIPAPSVTIKAMGFQWGWTYSYPDFGDFEFTSLIAPRDTVPSYLYRFATTNDIVVPAGETIRLATSAQDVIHAWAMPAFAVKIDAIPGRFNETWFYTEQEGTYYGQCSEICGIDHAFMPISVRVVSREEFEAWVDERRALEGEAPLFSGADQLAAGSAAPATDLN